MASVVAQEGHSVAKATPAQERVLEAVRSLTEAHGYAPTVREVCRHGGWASPSTVHHHLEQLRRLGLVWWVAGRNRTLRVL